MLMSSLASLLMLSGFLLSLPRSRAPISYGAAPVLPLFTTPSPIITVLSTLGSLKPTFVRELASRQDRLNILLKKELILLDFSTTVQIIFTQVLL